MPIVGGGITGSGGRGLSTPKTQELINQAVENFLTEAEIDTGYTSPSEVTEIITPLIASFLTQSEIAALGYQSADQVTAIVAPLISDFLTQTQIEALGYVDRATTRTHSQLSITGTDRGAGLPNRS